MSAQQPPNIVNHNYFITQYGGHMSTAPVTQIGHTNVIASDEAKVALTAWLGEFRKFLDDEGVTGEAREEAESTADAIDAALRSPKPRKAVLETCLQVAADFLRDFSTSLAATYLLGQLQQIPL